MIELLCNRASSHLVSLDGVELSFVPGQVCSYDSCRHYSLRTCVLVKNLVSFGRWWWLRHLWCYFLCDSADELCFSKCVLLYPCFFMNTARSYKILVWNVRGINSQQKWDAIRDKLGETSADIVCFQETKCDNFDSSYLRNFCPRSLSRFEFFPSVGASRGLIVIWNPALFDGSLISANAYSITMKFSCALSGNCFHLTNIYGPCAPDGKASFINWLF
jgi:hypothetical protein